jgi:hypothetical protein
VDKTHRQTKAPITGYSSGGQWRGSNKPMPTFERHNHAAKARLFKRLPLKNPHLSGSIKFNIQR